MRSAGVHSILFALTLSPALWLWAPSDALAAPPPSPTPPKNYVEGEGGADPVIDARTPEEDHSASWGYATGKDQGPNYVKPAAKVSQDLKVNPVGFYQGVSTAGENQPPFAPQEIGTGAAVLTWTGFEVKGAESRVFFQLSSPVSPEGTEDGLTLTYRLPNTSVNVKNNQRRLDTRYFRTPVASVSVSRRGSDTVVTLKLRREALANTSVVPAANGYSMFVIGFTEDVAPTPTADTPPAP